MNDHELTDDECFDIEAFLLSAPDGITAVPGIEGLVAVVGPGCRALMPRAVGDAIREYLCPLSVAPEDGR